MKENLIKRLLASVKCAVCGQHYQVDKISILDHEEDLWFLEASCFACETQCLVAVIIKEEEVPQAVTDLTEAELDSFESAGALTTDDVLDIHDLLKDFDGDFSQLFAQRKT